MKTATSEFALSLFLPTTRLLVAFMILFSLPLVAQPPASSSVDAQREAMRKLSFLAGHWAGPVTIVRGTGEPPLHLTQTEEVDYKLDGLVLLIEGRTTSASGKVQYSALATIAYDDTSRRYRLRAYNDGHYLDTELSVLEHGFSWGFTSGPAYIVNNMQLTGKGEWSESTEVTVGSNPPHRSVEMLLQH
jgi:hypothetical protein